MAGEWGLPPVPPYKPRRREVKIIGSRDIALTAVFSALYAIAVISQGLSAAASVQLRFADCLLPLSAIFGWPVIAGVSIGCFIGNAYLSSSLPNGIYDIIFGPIANLLATLIIFRLRHSKFLGCMLAAFAIGIIVGGYIWIIPGLREAIASLAKFLLGNEALPPLWILTILSMTVSSLIAIAGIGYTLLKILSKKETLNMLKAKGFKIYES